eukprot:3937508-Rhodomonas_salina.1
MGREHARKATGHSRTRVEREDSMRRRRGRRRGVMLRDENQDKRAALHTPGTAQQRNSRDASTRKQTET